LKRFKLHGKPSAVYEKWEQMMYAKTLAAYWTLQDEFDTMEMTDTVRNYFNNNWRNMTDKWVHAYRNEIQCLGQNTNNRIERTNGVVKDFIKKHAKFPECIRGVMQFLDFQKKNLTLKVFNEQ
jgi:hypothetical protein